MIETFDIAGYARISVDDELDRDNVSIENQKAIIEDFVRQKFPGSTLTFYEDRDRSGYTFEQREGYQAMRRGLVSHQYDILIVKDFSRFSRRNSRGLVELEDLRDAGVRIISIGDGIDFPNDDDWLKIQFQFLINEMPVTDTSKKVRNVIKRRQADGKWICAAPYGYMINARQEFEIVPTEADIVRTIFRLYNEEGWGYKKIAGYLTDQGIPTPRMAERDRKEAAGKEYHRAVKRDWAIVTVQGILDNDFYIGTLRQGKYSRKKINGKDILQDVDEQIVIEKHHQAIIDYRTFATTRALREKRSTSHYRGIKKYDNVYSGFLTCGDCGAPMFAMSRKELKPAYTCGTYHRRGRAGCTSHHIRVDKLDELLKLYIRRVMDHSADMLEQRVHQLTLRKIFLQLPVPCQPLSSVRKYSALKSHMSHLLSHPLYLQSLCINVLRCRRHIRPPYSASVLVSLIQPSGCALLKRLRPGLHVRISVHGTADENIPMALQLLVPALGSAKILLDLRPPGFPPAPLLLRRQLRGKGNDGVHPGLQAFPKLGPVFRQWIGRQTPP